MTTPPAITATTPATRALPDCEYRDEPVLGDPARDWATLVLDTVFTLLDVDKATVGGLGGNNEGPAGESGIEDAFDSDSKSINIYVNNEGHC